MSYPTSAVQRSLEILASPVACEKYEYFMWNPQADALSRYVEHGRREGIRLRVHEYAWVSLLVLVTVLITTVFTGFVLWVRGEDHRGAGLWDQAGLIVLFLAVLFLAIAGTVTFLRISWPRYARTKARRRDIYTPDHVLNWAVRDLGPSLRTWARSPEDNRPTYARGRAKRARRKGERRNIRIPARSPATEERERRLWSSQGPSVDPERDRLVHALFTFQSCAGFRQGWLSRNLLTSLHVLTWDTLTKNYLTAELRSEAITSVTAMLENAVKSATEVEHSEKGRIAQQDMAVHAMQEADVCARLEAEIDMAKKTRDLT